MDNRLFRIHPNSRDSPFMEACAAFLTPKMPSGCNLRRVALPQDNIPALSDRPSASDYQEGQVALPQSQDDMREAVWIPVSQPYSGASGKAWMAKEYGVTMDTSSLMSSETERDESDDEIISFDLGPEAYEPGHMTRMPSDEFLDDIQQGLHPDSSEPRHDPYDKFLVMPNQPSIMDMKRTDVDSELNKPPSPWPRAPSQTIRWDFDFGRVLEDPAQTSTPRSHVRKAHALDRQLTFHDLAPPRRPRHRIQPSVWLFNTCLSQKRLLRLFCHRACRTSRQKQRRTLSLTPRLRWLSLAGVGVGDRGAHLRHFLQPQEWGLETRHGFKR